MIKTILWFIDKVVCNIVDLDGGHMNAGSSFSSSTVVMSSGPNGKPQVRVAYVKKNIGEDYFY